MATAFTSLCCSQTSAWLLLLGDKGGSVQCYQIHTHTLRQVEEGGVRNPDDWTLVTLVS